MKLDAATVSSVALEGMTCEPDQRALTDPLAVPDPVARTVHGHEFLGGGRVDRHGAVEIVLCQPRLDGNAEKLRHLAGIGSEDMRADDPARGGLSSGIRIFLSYEII